MDVESRPSDEPPGAKSLGPGSISVVVPVYNGEAFLRAALESVVGQSLPPAEIIVVDDGSTDGSAAIARDFGATVVHQANRGLAAARNTGTHVARGEYVAYLDADDVWLADKLRRQLDALRANGGAAFAFTEYHLFDETGVGARLCLAEHPAFCKTVGRFAAGRDVVIEARANRPVLPDDYILPSSVMLRRADFLAVGGFDESIRVSEDHEFFLRLFARAPGIAVLQPLVLYRRHAAQITSKPIAVVAAFFEIERRIAAAPERYSPGDVAYFGAAAYLAHRRIGVLHARLGAFDEAREAFRRSLRCRLTPLAAFGLASAWAGQSPLGARVFVAVRAALRRLRALRSLGRAAK